MIRKLAADELVWFLSRSFAFLGHSDPLRLAGRLVPRMRDAGHEAAGCRVLFVDGSPVAGAHLRAPDPDDDDQSLWLSQLWFEDDPEALTTLVAELIERHRHEAIYAPLHALGDEPRQRLGAALEPLGFELERHCELRFELADVPPLGAPLVLEAWTPASDVAFREIYRMAEGSRPSDATWAWLKRKGGPFRPDLWFLGRETLDQEPVGYALCGARSVGVDGSYSLSAVGVLAEHRGSSEMLRRLVVSLLHELGSRSPLGRVDTRLSLADPKLVQILESLGFERTESYAIYLQTP